MARQLALDYETYSDIDLLTCGMHRYTDSPNFEILLIAYSVDDGETQIIDVAMGEDVPKELMDILKDNSVVKTAFNAAFERLSTNRFFGLNLQPKSWLCTAVQASMLSLPLSLDGVGTVLNLDKKKMSEGKDLIKYFCCPCKPTKVNGGRTRNRPEDAPEKWELFKSYCVRDVDVEKQIRNKLVKFPIPGHEQKLYCLDQRINDRGIMVDRKLVKHAITCDLLYKEKATKRAYELTELDNPNSVSQLKEWLQNRDIEVDSLAKDAVKDLISHTDGDVNELLKLRLCMSKTSIKKYEAIDRGVCSDSRVHGLLQFYGANRTGRWAGRLVQIHNLPQNHLSDLNLARSLIAEGRYEDVEMFYESTPNVLSELIRTAFVAKPGCRFIVSDFSAIEARVLAWLAGETWVIETFRGKGNIYEMTASKMFGIPLESITKDSPYRARGKVAVLGCGYGAGAIGLKAVANGALDDDELQSVVTTWRNTNPHITQFWWDIDAAAISAVRQKKMTRVGLITFEYLSGILFITLPSGRKLSYIKPRMGMNKFGREGITYEGIGESRKWMRLETYGPKLVENIVQAISRDILADAMLRLEGKGFDIVCHVHDEVVLEVPEGASSVEEVNEIMAVNPSWAEGLPLKAAGFTTPYYMKD